MNKERTMPRILYDFLCNDCGEVVEKFVESSVHEVACECGGTMTRLISAPTIALDGTDPGFPDAYDKWARKKEQAAKKEWAKVNRG